MELRQGRSLTQTKERLGHQPARIPSQACVEACPHHAKAETTGKEMKEMEEIFHRSARKAAMPGRAVSFCCCTLQIGRLRHTTHDTLQ
ncbi:hypothetical protein E2C01_047408 [Portunus trituberculatus]|uniref:Uncharacterized protein n=1 Tax=Portunus trituberculatus TaxID=210409 RepID=A0A5B7GAE5_PORTR|nr:hypothetical protein [Portunus trituberculatus]